METKICNKCNKELSINNFYVYFDKRRGYSRSFAACKACRKVYMKPINKKHHMKYKDIVMTHYGNKCVCCDEANQMFLTIDHIDGYKQNPNYGKRVRGNMYSDIIKKGFPENLQILCWNCNCAKGSYGVCPHTLESKLQDVEGNYQQVRQEVLWSLEVA